MNHRERPAILQSVFQADIREVNAMEQRIVRSEDDADAQLWEQAAKVVELLKAGMTQRALASKWVNARTGEAYSVAHVNYTKQAFVQFTEQVPRPRFRDAYNAVANAKSAHVAANSGENEWYTPPEFIKAARAVMGGIDLDPASSDAANLIVGAKAYFTEADNGLDQGWSGRVWMNPPYAQPLIAQFSEALVTHHRSGDVPEACVLVNNATETGWFQAVLAVASGACFISGRVRFVSPDGKPSAPLQGQAILYLGEKLGAFIQHFSEFGPVLVRKV